LKIKIYTIGGTIDKVYFDKKSTYKVGASVVREILNEANITVDYEIESIIQKDSLDMTDDDRRQLLEKISADPHNRIVITHGTDTMISSAQRLKKVKDKTIVFTGSMQPARFRNSDAVFNVGFAMGAVQTLAPGSYICMNGKIFNPDKARKNVDAEKFENIE